MEGGFRSDEIGGRIFYRQRQQNKLLSGAAGKEPEEAGKGSGRAGLFRLLPLIHGIIAEGARRHLGDLLATGSGGLNGLAIEQGSLDAFVIAVDELVDIGLEVGLDHLFGEADVAVETVNDEMNALARDRVVLVGDPSQK